MKTMPLKFLLVLLLTTSPMLCRAEAIQCFQAAAKTYWLDPYLLLAIAQSESGLRPDAVNINPARRGRRASQDYGLMQINSRWLPKLKQYNINATTLADPCTNIHVGAWILASLIQQHGRIWEAVGAYNAGCNTLDKTTCRRLRDRYISVVSRHYQRFRQVPLFRGKK